ncbi:hypothetical protein BV22DRAFT_1051573 [Leucogyrophana mollusca]|uniref:Uncharacterized protein n=1 Tax=Leucogyrophana mollusca TaxID=85980 RepID=A0ACB8B1G6_9AGAM|nr:hypothetical protein BV22DRAFT_1051573 [Leucogyrophana mollusca]
MPGENHRVNPYAHQAGRFVTLCAQFMQAMSEADASTTDHSDRPAQTAQGTEDEANDLNGQVTSSPKERGSMEGALQFVEHHQCQITTTRQSGYTQPSSSPGPKGHGSSEKRNDASRVAIEESVPKTRDTRQITVRALLDCQGVAASKGHTIKSGQQRLFTAQVVEDDGGQENQLNTDLEAHEVLKLPQSLTGEELQDEASVEEPLEGPQYETDEQLTVEATINLMINGEASGSLLASSPPDSLPELEDTEGSPMGGPSNASSNRWFYHQTTGVTDTSCCSPYTAHRHHIVDLPIASHKFLKHDRWFLDMQGFQWLC